eukprot:TRINITY_DN47246_c0_g1_i1.p1 TRINITY_DN47246_c0_g1~~TRINITY_DN47246_c0_g1_i1.p1  ORF type:complete len:455 (+),score=53.96 TRINITY_DN47246_c0_g1_i1:33-1367(+)
MVVRTLLPESHRAVALLDVDDTLFFGIVGSSEAELRLNVSLLEALRRRGISDVYFFTDMRLSSHSVLERQELIRVLQARYGFSVHGVLTPCDLAWSSLDDREAMLLHQLCFESGKEGYAGPLYGPEFQAFVESRKSQLPRVNEALTAYKPETNRPGKAYSDALREVTGDAASLEACHDTGVSQATMARGAFAKALGDHLALQLGYSHVKGLLLDLFLRHAPSWMESVVVFDDNRLVNETITNFAPVPDDLLSAGALAYSVSKVPISMVHVAGLQVDAQFYEEALDAHCMQTHTSCWSVLAKRLTRKKAEAEHDTVLLAVLPPEVACPTDVMWSQACSNEQAARALFGDAGELPRLLQAIDPGEVKRLSCYWEVTPKSPGISGAVCLRWEVAPRQEADIEELAKLLHEGCKRIEFGSDLEAWRESPWHVRIPAPTSASSRECVLS